MNIRFILKSDIHKKYKYFPHTGSMYMLLLPQPGILHTQSVFDNAQHTFILPYNFFNIQTHTHVHTRHDTTRRDARIFLTLRVMYIFRWR